MRASSARPASAVSDALRKRLNARLEICRTCKRAQVSVREIAAQSGLSVFTLHRFIRGDGVSSRFIDDLAAYLGKDEANAG